MIECTHPNQGHGEDRLSYRNRSSAPSARKPRALFLCSYTLNMVDIDNTSRNILLVGGAGTGKSYILRQYAETHPNVILCAPTGIAAVNIGGATMHSVFGIPRDSIGARISKKQDNAVRLLAAADAVLIDEISMCRSDVFSFAMRVLKKAEKRKGSRIRIIAAGDFAQLPPVVTVEDAKRMKKAGLDPSGYAFTAPEWAKMCFHVVELEEVQRQNDIEFIHALNAIRAGKPEGLRYFDPLVDPSLAPNTDGAKDRLVRDIMETRAIYICGTNAEAQTVNDACIAAIDAPATGYTAEVSGRALVLPMERVVMYKPGERVIFTVNDVIHGAYQNGTMGTVCACFADHVLVQIDGGAALNVYAHMWTLHSYRASGGKIVRSEAGMEKQIPLKAAYAITVHKAQGKTVDRAIVSPRTFAPGQLYVALSRVRTPGGLRLTEPVSAEMLITSDEAQKFAQNGYKWSAVRKARKKSANTDSAGAKSAKAKKRVAKCGDGTCKSSAKTGMRTKTSAKKHTRKKSAAKSATATVSAKKRVHGKRASGKAQKSNARKGTKRK